MNLDKESEAELNLQKFAGSYNLGVMVREEALRSFRGAYTLPSCHDL